MDSNIFPPSKRQIQPNNFQAFSSIQSHCSNLLHNVSKTLNPLFNPEKNLSSEPNNIFSALDSLRNLTKQAFDAGISRLNPVSGSHNAAVWARITDGGGKSLVAPIRRSGGGAPGLSADAIEERMAGVPVYALSNSNEEFVLVSGASTGKSMGFLFCREEDAEALLREMKSMNPGMRKEGSKVVPLALSKVFQLKVNGVAFRLIPESTQVTHAVKERKKAGFPDDDFPGVPVFQSRSLILRSENKSYRPVFFRKEDLEKSLQRASQQQNRLNPALKPGDIQVAVFEEILKGMKEKTTSKWDDIVFIPPGFEVSADPTQQSA
ncbi:PREDICTED: protein TIC 22-like, chloroplastic [Tarenaya hassleriana]|uniref:protein TIC 22-like, chloroplastic n=1 Tax=Tarenaya hassleriana TaxID=28532 RepID=UPI00053C5E13|nr:PREDICTED: protein TIC 22-like, chloroplastic [Tarenaya hassleriana]